MGPSRVRISFDWVTIDRVTAWNNQSEIRAARKKKKKGIKNGSEWDRDTTYEMGQGIHDAMYESDANDEMGMMDFVK